MKTEIKNWLDTCQWDGIDPLSGNFSREEISAALAEQGDPVEEDPASWAGWSFRDMSFDFISPGGMPSRISRWRATSPEGIGYVLDRGSWEKATLTPPESKWQGKEIPWILCPDLGVLRYEHEGRDPIVAQARKEEAVQLQKAAKEREALFERRKAEAEALARGKALKERDLLVSNGWNVEQREDGDWDCQKNGFRWRYAPGRLDANDLEGRLAFWLQKQQEKKAAANKPILKRR